MNFASTRGNTSVGQQAKNYIHQHCVDTGCHLENLPRATGIDGERERESRESLVSAGLNDDGYYSIILLLYFGTARILRDRNSPSVKNTPGSW